MDERAIKRLLITLAVAIAIIMLAKFMLTKTFTRLNQAAAEKKQAAAAAQPAAPVEVVLPAFALPESAPLMDVTEAAAPAASAVAGAAQ